MKSKELSFDDLLNLHGGIIHKVSRLYSDTETDREDLVQEISYQLYKAYPGFRAESKLSTWVYRVALNTALAGFRKRRPTVVYPDRLPETEVPPVDLTLSPTERLLAAIRRLPETDRALVALYLEEMSHAEIAAVLGITTNNVSVKLYRIKTKLKTILQSKHHAI